MPVFTYSCIRRVARCIGSARTGVCLLRLGQGARMHRPETGDRLVVKVRDVTKADIEHLLSLVQVDEMGIDPDVGTWLAARDDDGAVLGLARLTELGGART